MQSSLTPSSSPNRRERRQRARTGRVRDHVARVLRDESGNLVQSLAGVTISAIFIAAGTFAAVQLVPMRLDHQSVERLEDVVVAERDAITSGGTYLNYGSLGIHPVHDAVEVATHADGSCYTAVARSGSGNAFIVESTSGKELGVQELAKGYVVSCVPSATARQMLVDAGVKRADANLMIAAVDRFPAPKDVVYDASTGRLTFTGVLGANSYRIESLDRATGAWSAVTSVRVGGNGTSLTAKSFSTSIPEDHRQKSLRITAQRTAAASGRDSWSTGIRAVENKAALFSDFEAGITGLDGADWEAWDSEDSWIPASRAGGVQVVRPGSNSDGTAGNTSLGALSVKEHQRVRTPLIDVSGGSAYWELRFDGRLSGQAKVRIEWYDAADAMVAATPDFSVQSTRGDWVSARGAESAFEYANAEAKPATATQARVVIVGSGNTQANAMQIDNVRFTAVT